MKIFEEIMANAVPWQPGFDRARLAFEEDRASFWTLDSFAAQRRINALDALNKGESILSAFALEYQSPSIAAIEVDARYRDFLASLIPLNHKAAMALYRAYDGRVLYSSLLSRRDQLS